MQKTNLTTNLSIYSCCLHISNIYFIRNNSHFHQREVDHLTNYLPINLFMLSTHIKHLFYQEQLPTFIKEKLITFHEYIKYLLWPNYLSRQGPATVLDKTTVETIIELSDLNNKVSHNHKNIFCVFCKNTIYSHLTYLLCKICKNLIISLKTFVNI